MTGVLRDEWSPQLRLIYRSVTVTDGECRIMGQHVFCLSQGGVIDTLPACVCHFVVPVDCRSIEKTDAFDPFGPARRTDVPFLLLYCTLIIMHPPLQTYD